MATVVLDVNETLSDMSPLGSVLHEHGVEPELAATWFASVLRDGFALSLHGAAPPFLDLGRQLLERLLVGRTEADPAAVSDAVLAALGRLSVHADVAPAVRQLRSAGHRVTALTNGGAAGARGLLERAGLLEGAGVDAGVDTVLSVEAVSAWKPHADAYRYAADQLGVPLRQLVMVAVHPWDVDGASRAGMRTVLLDRSGLGAPASFTPPDHTITSLEELVAVL